MTEREFISTMPDLPSADRRRLILIVEDEFVNREILRMILEQDYETAVAETGAEAMPQNRTPAQSAANTFFHSWLYYTIKLIIR